MHWYTDVLRQYATFTGRARRQEFWMFVLINVAVSLVLALVDNLLGLRFGTEPATAGILGTIYSLAVLLPSLAVAVRRLHDTGRSGWWLLIGLIPLIGGIVLIVFYALEGRPGPNAHGENPKTVNPAYS